jgi:anti-sigma regulatory factor (Ser/Thr protein kinase)
VNLVARKARAANRKVARKPAAAQAARAPQDVQLALCVPSQTRFLNLIRELSEKMAEISGFDPSHARQIALAIDEGVTNSIQHAYRGDTRKQVELRFSAAGDGDFCVEILDAGSAFQPGQAAPLDLARAVREHHKGGLGMHLMSKIMDSVSYDRAARRNICRLVKHLPDRKP